jgi:hypothetical protein
MELMAIGSAIENPLTVLAVAKKRQEEATINY